MEISPETTVKLKAGAAFLIVSTLISGALWVDALRDAVAANSQKIHILDKSQRLGSLYDQLGDLNREKRGYQLRVSVTDPEQQPGLYAQLLDNIQSVQDELDKTQKVLDCVLADQEPCE